MNADALQKFQTVQLLEEKVADACQKVQTFQLLEEKVADAKLVQLAQFAFKI